MTMALKRLLAAAALALVWFAPHAPALAEYGDIVMNRHSEKDGVRPVIFPHWVHRIQYQCKVCHGDLDFKMKAGSSTAKMDDISAGKSCGKCHNGKIAFEADRCDTCHSGLPGLKTGPVGGHATGGPGRY